MLKISEGKGTRQRITLRLEGQVIGPWVEELRQVCRPLLDAGTPLALDLRDVTFADETGVVLLRHLVKRGVRLIKAMPFVEEQLKATEKDHGGG